MLDKLILELAPCGCFVPIVTYKGDIEYLSSQCHGEIYLIYIQ